MSKLIFRIAALFAFGVLALASAVPTGVRAQTPAVDPAADLVYRNSFWIAEIKLQNWKGETVRRSESNEERTRLSAALRSGTKGKI